VQAIVVPGDSTINQPRDLRNELIGVTFHAGSHYMTLRMLEGFIQRDEINAIHVGSDRYEALLRGEVAAATLMEPWISLAEKQGGRVIMESHYLSSDISGPELDQETWNAINRAVRKAVKRINDDKRKYMHYLIDQIPPHLGTLEPDDMNFHRLRYIDPQPYTETEFKESYDWMLSWGLAAPGARYEELVENRV